MLHDYNIFVHPTVVCPLKIIEIWSYVYINDQGDETSSNPGDCLSVRLSKQAITCLKIIFLDETCYIYSLAPKGGRYCRWA